MCPNVIFWDVSFLSSKFGHFFHSWKQVLVDQDMQELLVIGNLEKVSAGLADPILVHYS